MCWPSALCVAGAGGSALQDWMQSDGLTSYLWNARNQLAGISGATSASFAYDAAGRRRTKTTSGTTSFLYDGVNAAQELVAGSPAATTLTSGINQVFQRTEGAATRAASTDPLGVMVALVDASGAVQTQYTYEPFGTWNRSGLLPGEVLFTHTGSLHQRRPVGPRGGTQPLQLCRQQPDELLGPVGVAEMVREMGR